MLVCLVQHGEAVSEEVDPRRPLSERGRAEVERVARLLARAGFKPGRIIHSGKLRAQQTAEILAKELGVERVEKGEGLDPLADPAPWLERLEAASEDTVVVGHLPFLAKLAGLMLVGSQDAEPVRFRYGGVFCFEKAEGRWRLVWAVTPDVVPS
ncbi:MAG: phosphohistidine phosphatase SixA [Thermoproteota archaeon]